MINPGVCSSEDRNWGFMIDCNYQWDTGYSDFVMRDSEKLLHPQSPARPFPWECHVSVLTVSLFCTFISYWFSEDEIIFCWRLPYKKNGDTLRLVLGCKLQILVLLRVFGMESHHIWPFRYRLVRCIKKFTKNALTLLTTQKSSLGVSISLSHIHIGLP